MRTGFIKDINNYALLVSNINPRTIKPYFAKSKCGCSDGNVKTPTLVIQWSFPQYHQETDICGFE